MRKIICRIILAALASFGLLYAGDGQGNDDQRDGHAAVPWTGGGELRPHVWMSAHPSVKVQTVGNLSPSQVSTAYGIDLAGGYGLGATVAIVDAYDSPNVEADLATFASQWNISCTTGSSSFTKLNQAGNPSPLPARDSGWEIEINLDTQWVHAIAPCANIILIEANSNSTSDLMQAVLTARSRASVVSMSWGQSESPRQTTYDPYFASAGVTFLASSGDAHGVVTWPSSSPNVIAVGGTNLTFNSNGTFASETAWSGSGGGCSSVENAITAQKNFVPSSCRNRATPDVAMDGGSVGAVQTYVSSEGGWYAVWGTSLSVQLLAGVVAIANGERSSSLTSTLVDIYADAAGTFYSSNFRDITSGTAGAAKGWDFVTGLGSPLVNSLISNYLVKQD